jgi:hypothetical protein
MNEDNTFKMITQASDALAVSPTVIHDLLGFDAATSEEVANKRVRILKYVLSMFNRFESAEAKYYGLTHAYYKIDESAEFADSFHSLLIQNDDLPNEIFWLATSKALEFYHANIRSS